NLETPSAGLSVRVVTPSIGYSIWTGAAVPAVIQTDAQAVELGLQFRSDVAGPGPGGRFFQGGHNTRPHVGKLWGNRRHPTATATFSNESASGWQQVLFGAPVAVAANTTYVVSYHTNSGHYGYDIDYFIQHGVDNGVLHALSGPATGGNGVYVYGPTGFPSNS